MLAIFGVQEAVLTQLQECSKVGVDCAFSYVINIPQALESVEKSLADYLEVKRMAFPRLYFLSDVGLAVSPVPLVPLFPYNNPIQPELLDLLSAGTDIVAAAPHIPACFDSVGGGGDDMTASNNRPTLRFYCFQQLSHITVLDCVTGNDH